jgi:hypothetical protein
MGLGLVGYKGPGCPSGFRARSSLKSCLFADGGNILEELVKRRKGIGKTNEGKATGFA